MSVTFYRGKHNCVHRLSLWINFNYKLNKPSTNAFDFSMLKDMVPLYLMCVSLIFIPIEMAFFPLNVGSPPINVIYHFFSLSHWYEHGF